jgi:hypothetical protein
MIFRRGGAMNCRTVRRLGVLAIAVLASVTGSIVAATPAHASNVGQDPYRSLCSNSAYPANAVNTNVDSQGGPVLHLVNWYSRDCNTNWAVLTWGSPKPYGVNVAIYSNGQLLNGKNVGPSYETSYTPSAHIRCYPTSCNYLDLNSGFYTGTKQPVWTDMIDGTQVACIRVSLELNGGGQANHAYGAACA